MADKAVTAHSLFSAAVRPLYYWSNYLHGTRLELDGRTLEAEKGCEGAIKEQLQKHVWALVKLLEEAVKVVF